MRVGKDDLAAMPSVLSVHRIPVPLPPAHAHCRFTDTIAAAIEQRQLTMTEELTLAGHALKVKAIIGAKPNKQPPLGHSEDISGTSST